jgi:vacuolar-type H+-ATPase subunit C/Vma6
MSDAERAYTYAKSCGIIGKSFLGKRAGRLSALTSPDELEQRLFPETKNLHDSIDAIETKIAHRSAKAILSVLGAFHKTPKILVLLARSYEYADLKRFMAAINAGEAEAPPWTPLGKFSTVNFAAYPDRAAMLKGCEFRFLAEADNATDVNMELDRLYYKNLIEAIVKIPKYDFVGGRRLFFEEISLLNCTLAMRLRFYYGMSSSEVKKRLIHGKLTLNGRKLATDAEASLSMKIDHRADWENWRRRNFLNTETGGKYWKCDPRHFQTAASIYLQKLALRYFRSRPFSLDTVCCFIRLKQFEEQLLTGVVEGTKLNMSAADVLKTLGVPT